MSKLFQQHSQMTAEGGKKSHLLSKTKKKENHWLEDLFIYLLERVKGQRKRERES